METTGIFWNFYQTPFHGPNALAGRATRPSINDFSATWSLFIFSISLTISTELIPKWIIPGWLLLQPKNEESPFLYRFWRASLVEFTLLHLCWHRANDQGFSTHTRATNIHDDSRFAWTRRCVGEWDVRKGFACTSCGVSTSSCFISWYLLLNLWIPLFSSFLIFILSLRLAEKYNDGEAE